MRPVPRENPDARQSMKITLVALLAAATAALAASAAFGHDPAPECAQPGTRMHVVPGPSSAPVCDDGARPTYSLHS